MQNKEINNSEIPGCKISDLFNLDETIAKPLFEKFTYPWEVLPHIKDFILELGPKLEAERGYKHLPEEEFGPDIWVSPSAKIAPTASLAGPLIVGDDAEIRHCAFVRGSAIVGDGATVGNSVELKNCILFNGSQVPHYNYCGDSVLGHKSHIGAGGITSNLKSDKTNVVLRDFYRGGNATNKDNSGIAPDNAFDNASDSASDIACDITCMETGLRKFGAILGDNVEVGCNSVLNPGTVIGSGSTVYPTSCVRGFIPANSIFKDKDNVVQKR
ncbi:MAG: UDP-N-acetylglucosamine pyrophosphorylase [Coriobacteriia bacterium]|nr:UDP-N-acetylglucosamine pyrophosphorylase [Coriobacteriia bacterium]